MSDVKGFGANSLNGNGNQGKVGETIRLSFNTSKSSFGIDDVDLYFKKRLSFYHTAIQDLKRVASSITSIEDGRVKGYVQSLILDLMDDEVILADMYLNDSGSGFKSKYDYIWKMLNNFRHALKIFMDSNFHL